VLGDLLQSDLLPHLLEPVLAQRLGENVGQLISSANVVGLDASIFQTLPDEVILDPDVLAPVMEDWILGQG